MQLNLRPILLLLIPVAIMLAGLLLVTSPGQAQTPLVDNPADVIADDPGAGVGCTLREAILTVNGAAPNNDCAAGNQIAFDPAVGTIAIVGTSLPALVVDGITINGDLGGGDVVILDGAALVDTAAAEDGLTIRSAGNTIQNLALVNFPDNGMLLDGAGATNNQLQGLFIGTDTTFAGGLGNGDNGVLVSGGAQNNQIGISPVTGTQDRNTIVSNGQNGIEIRGINAPVPGNDTTGNVIAGSTIGVQGNFVLALPNLGSGVLITTGANNNTVGDAGAGLNDRNVIGGNTGSGITITGALTANNTVVNNRIGTDLAGTTNFPNAAGVILDGSTATNTIGPDNIITASTGSGVLIQGLATGNTVTTSSISQNGGFGVVLTGGSLNNSVTTSTIESNPLGGVEINTSTNNIIQQNLVRQNGVNGITIRLDGSNNNQLIGNTITNNTEDGIAITDDATGNTISQNSIATNGQLGIDLGNDGPTANDAGDGDTGPNNFQNFPASLLAVNTGGNVLLGGSIDGGANQPFTIEAFSNTVADVEGEIFVGAGNTNNGVFTLTLPVGVGQPLTTTTTDNNGNTSEFSAQVNIITLQASFTANPITGVAPLTVDFTDTSIINPPATPVTYNWDFADGTPDSALQNPTHTFTAPGAYVVTLTLCTSNGVVTLCDTAVLTITVLPPSPTPTNTLPPETPVSTDTPVILPTATVTLTFTPSLTPSNTATLTRTPTLTVTPSNTATNTATRTATFTVTPSNTATSTNTATNTATATATRTPTLTATPIPTSTATLTRTATIPPTSTPQPTDTLTPLPTSTIAPEVTVIKEEVDDDTFTIVIDNDGVPLTNLIVEEELAPGVIYVSSVPGSPLCKEEAGVITCVVGTLPTGEDFEVQITVDAEGVDITSGQTDIISDNFRTQIDDAFIVKSSQPPFASPGDPITYTIRVINPTTRVITGIEVVDIMPEAVAIDSISSIPAGVTRDGQNIRFTAASLAPGERITITINGTLREGEASPQIANRACLTTATTERPRCAVAGFVRANALPSTGEASIQSLVIALLAGLMTIGTILFFVLYSRAPRNNQPG